MSLAVRSCRLRLALVLTAAVIGPAVALHAQADAQWVDGRLAGWYERAARNAPGRWGIAIADQSGRILWSVNPDEPLMPASTVKLFTTGFARSVLGGSARRATRVVGTGSIDPASGTWTGSWALELNGDPSLERGEGSGPMLYDLALQLASAGIRKLNGPLRVQSADGPAYATYPTTWSRRHYGRLFAPPVGPLTLHENIVWFTIQPGTRAGQPARLIETSPQGIASLVTVTAKTRTGRRTRLRFSQRANGGWLISGTIGARAGSRRFAAVASNPQVVLNAAWAAALQRAGIRWNPAAPAVAPAKTTLAKGATAKGGPAISALAASTPATGTPRVLAEVASAPLDSLASEINRRSHNLGAELLLQWAGGRASAAERLTAHVREVIGRSDGVYLVDGSGLSYDDRATPAAFVAYLAKFPATSAGRNFPQLLPANGTGTLKRLNAGFPGSGVVRAKTGTLGRASTVVGYLGRPEGVLLVSLMYNGSRPWAARQSQWQLFRLLGANGVVIPADTVAPPTFQLGGDETARSPRWPSLGGLDSAGTATDAR